MQENFKKMKEENKKRMRNKFSFDWETIYKELDEQLKNNIQSQWPFTPNMDTFTFRDMGKSNISNHERDINFMKMYKSEEYNIIEEEWNQVIKQSFGGWGELLTEAKTLYFNGNYKIIVPLLFSYIEAFLSNYTTDFNDGRFVDLIHSYTNELVEKKTLEFDYYILKSNETILKKSVFRYAGFEDNKPFFNRNWVLHGRYDPSNWNETDVVKLIAILSSLAFMQEMIKDEKNY